jgi:hypothetical protein
MTSQHPIVPPPDRIHNWLQLEKIGYTIEQIITVAAQYGADLELEACCALLKQKGVPAWSLLRAARRPKPPSLKEQALTALGEMSIEPCLINGVDANASVRAKYTTIRRALEQLND